MPFKVAARTVLQLGAELISSDGVAFYELIKNSFDARSATVEIDVDFRMPLQSFRAARKLFGDLRMAAGDRNPSSSVISQMSAAVAAGLDPASPGTAEIVGGIRSAATWDALSEAIDECNSIVVADRGAGMSANTLDEVYLTIGTRSRLKDREARQHRGGDPPGGPSDAVRDDEQPPILGEKGLGRLSVMRLGQRLRVETATRDEPAWNLLRIDWRSFSHGSDALIESVPVAPEPGPRKADPAAHGTRIRVSALTSEWTFEKLREIATGEFSKLIDPFLPASRYQIAVRFNGRPIQIPPLSDLLFEYAHATVTAAYTTDGEPRLAGRVDYRLRRREKPVLRNLAELVSVTKVPPDVLKSLGPFDVVLYWFNRQLLRRELDGIGEKKQVLELQTEWSGGLKLYRDGFRVNPYGDKNDDWLDLDRKALASGGYKVNRAQIVGKVSVTAARNPALVDQTNREGLRDCPEKDALVAILKSLLEAEFRTFLNDVDDELRAQDPLTFADLGKRVLSEEQEIRRSLSKLVERHPEIKAETDVVQIVERSAQKIRDLMEAAQVLADRVEEGHSQLLHLASLGLMVEILAHELTRTTQNTLNTVTAAAKSVVDGKLSSVFRTLESQLKTLEKRLRVLDPLSVSGRQRKEEFDLVAWVEDVLVSHAAQFQRHAIAGQLRVVPQRLAAGFRVKAVKGMIVQILENLLGNSVYWLKVQQQVEPTFRPAITIEIDTQRREIRVTDNGPGIEPRRHEEIFQPFVTSKPPGEGKGLGLYISREIAKYHGATLALSQEPTTRAGRLNTFVLRLGGDPT